MASDYFVPLPSVLKLIAHDVRWNLLQLLSHSDYRVQDLVSRLGLPQNLVSYHLKQLRQGQLVTERRSIADERYVFYSLNLEQLQAFYTNAGQSLHPALIQEREDSALPGIADKSTPTRILFLCTENSARSQMAEALLRHLSHGTIEAFSAGSLAASEIHPLAIRVIGAIGVDISQQYPKHFEVFQGQQFDVIVTVCDRMLETCPTFPDDPERIHWSFPDPALVQGTEQEQIHAFEQTSIQLTTRIRFLLTRLERERRNRE
jgi:protein-tyrosine-phosphatase